MRLYFFVASFGIGVLFSTALNLSFSHALFALFLSLVIFAYARIEHLRFEFFILAPIVLFGFALGLGRMTISDMQPPDPLAAIENKKVTVIGLVSEDPDERESYTQLVISAQTESFQNKIQKTDFASKEKILARVPVQSKFRYGDMVELEGKLARPENFNTDSGRVFDYVNYLGKDGIRYQLEYAQGKVLRSGEGNFLKGRLTALKRTFENSISGSIPDPQGALMNGILLGAKQALGEEYLDDFKNAGLAHVVVLSGYNIAIVAKYVQKIFSFLPRALSLGSGALSVVLFTIIAGATASSVRAALMALIALLGKATRRDYSAFRGLVIAAFLMAFQNPMIVPYDPSFQLSFIATVGLITVSPIVGSKASFITPKHNIRETIVSTIATQLFVLPFLLYMSGQFSIAAFPANLLVLPFVPATMLLGTITSFTGLVSHQLALIPGFASYGLLSYMLLMTRFFAHIPFGQFLIKNFPAWGMALWYAVYAAFIWHWHSRQDGSEKKAEGKKFDTSMAFEIVE